MGKLIGYARVSTRQQDADRQVHDLLAAGVRRDDIYVDSGASGGRASRPQFDRAVAALEKDDTLVITTLDRLGRSTQNMLTFAEALGGEAPVYGYSTSAGETWTPRRRWAPWSSPSWRLWRRWSWRSNGNG